MSHQSVFIQHLTLDGKGTGNINFANDYSTAPIAPRVQPPKGTLLELHRLSIYVEDGGSFVAHKFGNMPALLNGIGVEVSSGDEAGHVSLLSHPAKTNGELIHYATNWSEMKGSPRSFVASWNFTDTFGQPFRLTGSQLENLRVILHDDFRRLETLEFLAHGHFVIDPATKLSF